MLFCSQQFLLFFVAVFAVYWALPWQRARVWLLLVASFGFYASWNKWLATIICATTALDYLIARGMEATASPRWRRLLLGSSLAANLGLLFYFKYANFFLRSLEEALQAAGASASFPVLSVILPVGISFYTFEAISYTIDVYRGRIAAERNFANFMLFILFFPHLIAGPIVRGRDFLPQIKRRKRWDWARLNLGAQYFLMGLFKKLAIADCMAIIADPVFANPELYNARAMWIALLAWTLQVYCDFSGYSDMALGTAHMLGYKLAQNFNMPYLAANIGDFWRRWHMSLSSWIRDYLYFPLGGSRAGFWRTGSNYFIAMVLAGMWHGAAWPYIVFGALQGAMLVVHRAFRLSCQRLPRLQGILETSAGTALRIAVTFFTFCLTLVIFRAPSLAAGGTMLKHMFLGHSGLNTGRNFLASSIVIVAVCHAVGTLGLWKKWIAPLPSPIRGLGFAAVLTVALVLAPEAQKAFVYFQF